MRYFYILLALMLFACGGPPDQPEPAVDTVATTVEIEIPDEVEPEPEEQPREIPANFAEFIELVRSKSEMTHGQAAPNLEEDYMGYQGIGVREYEGLLLAEVECFTGVGQVWILAVYDPDGRLLDKLEVHGPHDRDMTDPEWDYDEYSFIDERNFNVTHYSCYEDEEGEHCETTESTFTITPEGKFLVIAG